MLGLTGWRPDAGLWMSSLGLRKGRPPLTAPTRAACLRVRGESGTVGRLGGNLISRMQVAPQALGQEL